MATRLRISILFKSFDHDSSSLIEYVQRFSFIFLNKSIGTLFFSWSFSFLSLPPLNTRQCTHKANRHRWVIYTGPRSFSSIVSSFPITPSLFLFLFLILDLWIPTYAHTHTHHILILFSLVPFFGRVSVFRFSIFLSLARSLNIFIYGKVLKSAGYTPTWSSGEERGNKAQRRRVVFFIETDRGSVTTSCNFASSFPLILL